jgi:hypothetical protein
MKEEDKYNNKDGRKMEKKKRGRIKDKERRRKDEEKTKNKDGRKQEKKNKGRRKVGKKLLTRNK